MKKALFLLTLISFGIAGCQGTVDPGNDSDKGNTQLEGTVTLRTDKDIIIADGKYPANLSVILMDKSGVEHDVTSEVEIYYEGADAPLTDRSFTTSEEGEYEFYAVRGFDITNTVAVKAVKGVPALPEDTDADAVNFRHRMMLLQHTGTECPNCPRLMEVLKRLSEDEAYSQLYYHVASHSYTTGDPAYSSAASTLSKAMNPSGTYPWLTYNLTTAEGYALDDIKAAIDANHKDVADAGICASAAHVDGSVYAQVGIKAGAASKYRVAVWLLEDSIRGVQSGASASWQNMHNNCLRQMFGPTKNECIYGRPLGTLEAGQTGDFVVAIDLEEDWVPENCKLLIIAVAGNGDYELLNCAVCPVDGSVSYEYL